jgi:hypothetical protein
MVRKEENQGIAFLIPVENSLQTCNQSGSGTYSITTSLENRDLFPGVKKPER